MLNSAVGLLGSFQKAARHQSGLGSVPCTVRQRRKIFSQFQSLCSHDLDFRNLALVERFLELIVLVFVFEAYGGRILNREAIEDTVDPRPIRSAEAHRARLTRGIQITAFKTPCTCLLASVPDGHHLAVRCGVVVGNYVIVSLADDFAVLDNHACKRATCARICGFARQLKRGS